MRRTVQGLQTGTNYAAQVRAVSPDGQYSEWSEKFLFTTMENTTVPAAPATTTWVVKGDAFLATWTEVTLDISGQPAIIDSYELELTAGATSKTVIVPAQLGMDGNYTFDFATNRALFTTAQPNVSLRVRAVNHKGIKGNFSGSINAVNPVPGNVSGFTATAAQAGVDMVWTANTDDDLDRYEIYTGSTAGFTPSSGNRIFSGNVTHFFYTSTTFTLQYFKIRAYDKFNQPSATDASASATPISPFGGDTTAPATPTGLAATITTATTASLATSAAVSWTANSESDLAGYFVRYRQNGTTPWNVVRYDKTQTSAVISNLTPYVNYDFQIAAVDWSENMSAYSGTATGTGATNTAPSTPTAPTVAVNTMQAQVTVPGTKAAGGAMEADVVYYEVYGSTTTGFTPATTNMLGVVSTGPAMIETFQIPASGNGSTQTWFFKIIAVDNGGLKSTASAQTSGTPGLIQATNITDATITNAKISDLAANKITAGTGIINNLSVKAVLTVGDATTTGTIQSFDYAAGTQGFKLSSVGGVASLEINKGTIRAPALLIQRGAANLMNPKYADFELNASFYTTGLTLTGSTAAINTTNKMFNTASLAYSPTNVTNSVFLGATNTDYNIVVQPSTAYIVSFYAMVPTAGTAATLTGSLKYATSTTPGTLALTGVSLAANSTWARYSGVVTTPSTATGGAILSFSTNTSTGVLYIDGIQIEEQMSSATTPSSWNPPGSTSIDGNMIKTGAIQSTATTVVNGSTIPVWSIPLNGSASFANLQVRGNAVIGVLNDDDGAGSQMASGNYSAGVAGWMIRSDGVSEFRQIVSQSIDGAAIRANSLTVDTLTSGNLSAEINIGAGTSLVANGLMGESVGMGDYGFLVLGPQSNAVTFKQSTGTTRTLTTAVPHNFGDSTAFPPSGSKIIVTIGDPDYDTPAGASDFVLSAPTTTTFTYIRATSVTAGPTAVTSGIVQGLNNDLSGTSPTYIDFPTDGSQPNIISGLLTASSVVVTDGMSIRKASQIEQGAVLTINSVIQPPSTAPSANFTYNTFSFTQAANTYVPYAAMRLQNNNYAIVTNSGPDLKINEHSSTTGKFVAQRYAYTGSTNRLPRNIVYGPGAAGGAGRYYLYVLDALSNSMSAKVITFDTSWNQIGTEFVIATSGARGVAPLLGLGIGWDYTNNRIIMGYRQFSTSPSAGIIRYLALDAVTGRPTGMLSTNPNGYSQYGDMEFISQGDFDFGSGADVIVTKDSSPNDYFRVQSNAFAQISNSAWPSSEVDVGSAFWDVNTSKFMSTALESANKLTIYESGDSLWSGVAEQRRWVAYSWYRSVSVVSESTCSPVAAVLMPMRSRMQVTFAKIPTGGSSTPDAARVYVSTQPTNTFPTDFFLRNTIAAPSTTAAIDPYATVGSTTPHLTNDFASFAPTPGQIISATGNSFWKGDDTAQFYRLVLQSNVDANATSDTNTPALRIGDIEGLHLRLDGNEIIAVSAVNHTTFSATQGNLILNAGGTTFTTDLAINGSLSAGADLPLSGIGSISPDQALAFIGPSYDILFAGGGNISGKIGTDFVSATGTCVAFQSSAVVIGVQAFNSASPSASNTQSLYASGIHSMTGGVIMDDLSGGGTTGASIGNGGRVVRTSSKTMKESIKPMTKEEYRSVLGLESYTFRFRQDSEQSPNDPRRYPGFIAEQGAEAGAELWVGRQHKVDRNEETGEVKITRDKNGEIIYFRTADVTVAHNALIKELFEEIESLKTQVKSLRA